MLYSRCILERTGLPGAKKNQINAKVLAVKVIKIKFDISAMRWAKMQRVNKNKKKMACSKSKICHCELSSEITPK